MICSQNFEFRERVLSLVIQRQPSSKRHYDNFKWKVFPHTKHFKIKTQYL